MLVASVERTSNASLRWRGQVLIFGVMRCTALVAIAWMSVSTVSTVTGFSQNSAAAIAEREEAQERAKRMNAKIEELEATILSYQQQFQTLSREIDKMRSDVLKARDSGQSSATREAIERLDKKIEEVDRKRLADQDSVMKELKQLRKDLLGQLSKPSTPQKAPTPAPNVPEKGFEYEIREGDYLTKLVAALNKEGHKLTQKQLREANPSVNWDKLKIGQKIFIPATSPN
jgi:septal ring factor EnvC (AmiA/AmiB activator)